MYSFELSQQRLWRSNVSRHRDVSDSYSWCYLYEHGGRCDPEGQSEIELDVSESAAAAPAAAPADPRPSAAQTQQGVPNPEKRWTRTLPYSNDKYSRLRAERTSRYFKGPSVKAPLRRDIVERFENLGGRGSDNQSNRLGSGSRIKRRASSTSETRRPRKQDGIIWTPASSARSAVDSRISDSTGSSFTDSRTSKDAGDIEREAIMSSYTGRVTPYIVKDTKGNLDGGRITAAQDAKYSAKYVNKWKTEEETDKLPHAASCCPADFNSPASTRSSTESQIPLPVGGLPSDGRTRPSTPSANVKGSRKPAVRPTGPRVSSVRSTDRSRIPLPDTRPSRETPIYTGKSAASTDTPQAQLSREERQVLPSAAPADLLSSDATVLPPGDDSVLPPSNNAFLAESRKKNISSAVKPHSHTGVLLSEEHSAVTDTACCTSRGIAERGEHRERGSDTAGREGYSGAGDDTAGRGVCSGGGSDTVGRGGCRGGGGDTDGSWWVPLGDGVPLRPPTPPRADRQRPGRPVERDRRRAGRGGPLPMTGGTVTDRARRTGADRENKPETAIRTPDRHNSERQSPPRQAATSSALSPGKASLTSRSRQKTNKVKISSVSPKQIISPADGKRSDCSVILEVSLKPKSSSVKKTDVRGAQTPPNKLPPRDQRVMVRYLAKSIHCASTSMYTV